MSEHDDWAEINRLEAENARLRAELAAERERADRTSAAADAKTEIMRERADKWEKRAINAAEEVCDLRLEHFCAEKDRDALRDTLSYVQERVKRIKYLAGLDAPIQEQANMAMDAIDAALNMGGEDE